MEVLPVLSSATMCSAWWYLLALCLCGLEVLLSLFSCFVLWTCDSWVPGIHEKWRGSLFSASPCSISVIVEDPDLMSNTGAPDNHLFCGVIWWQQRALSFLKIKVLSSVALCYAPMAAECTELMRNVGDPCLQLTCSVLVTNEGPVLWMNGTASSTQLLCALSKWKNSQLNSEVREIRQVPTLWCIKAISKSVLHCRNVSRSYFSGQ